MRKKLASIVTGCALAAAVSLGATGAAMAQSQEFKTKEAGQWNIRLRGIGVIPESNGSINTQSGASTGLTVGSVSSSFVPEVDFSYFATPNIAFELIAATTKANVKTNNGIDVGSTWILPPTLTAQYHPLPKEQFSPYLGVGVNYTWFYSTSSGSNPAVQNLSFKNNFGWALQAGIDVAVSGPWSVNLDVKKLFLSTVATTNVLKTTDVNLDPWIIGIGVGYRF